VDSVANPDRRTDLRDHENAACMNASNRVQILAVNHRRVIRGKLAKNGSKSRVRQRTARSSVPLKRGDSCGTEGACQLPAAPGTVLRTDAVPGQRGARGREEGRCRLPIFGTLTTATAAGAGDGPTQHGEVGKRVCVSYGHIRQGYLNNGDRVT
jgi:hypothetical protein